MRQTAKALLTVYINEYEQFYIRLGLPFGAKQKETYETAFNLDYATHRGSYERSRMAWNFWDRKIKLGDN